MKTYTSCQVEAYSLGSSLFLVSPSHMHFFIGSCINGELIQNPYFPQESRPYDVSCMHLTENHVSIDNDEFTWCSKEQQIAWLVHCDWTVISRFEVSQKCLASYIHTSNNWKFLSSWWFTVSINFLWCHMIAIQANVIICTHWWVLSVSEGKLRQQ